MNKKCLTLAALVLSLAFTGCGSKNDESLVTPTPSSSPLASQSTEQKAIKSGVIIEASMHVVTIQAPDGSTYIFNVDDTTSVDGPERLGNTVEISYDGEYKQGTIATAIRNTKLVDESEHASKSADTNKSAENAVWYMTGTVTGTSMHNIQFTGRDNGIAYTVLKNDKTEADENIVNGSVVRVYHTGSMKDGVTATKIELISDPKAENAATESMTGAIVDASNNVVIIKARDQNEYTFLKDDNTKAETSLTIGKTVKINFTGNVLDKPVATVIAEGKLTAME